MSTFICQNKNIRYQITGSGQPVLLIHGYCEDGTIWDHFIPLLPAAQYITMDLPGFGESEIDGAVSIVEMAEVVKSLLKHLKIERLMLIGHSMGGYVALAFAEKYGSMLSGLGLFHSHPYADTEAQKVSRTRSADFVKKNGSAHFIKQLMPKLFPDDFIRFNNFLLNNLTFRASRYPVTGIVNGQEAMRDRSDRTEVLRTATYPVLFIVGKKDTTVEKEKARDQTALPARAMIKILPDIGHMGMFEAPRKTAAMVGEFINFC